VSGIDYPSARRNRPLVRFDARGRRGRRRLWQKHNGLLMHASRANFLLNVCAPNRPRRSAHSPNSASGSAERSLRDTFADVKGRFIVRQSFSVLLEG